MGSDIQANFLWKTIIKLLFHKFIWKDTIVKSERMKKSIGFSKAIIIPNGIDLDKFKFIEKKIARNKVNFSNKKHIIFVAYPSVYIKNYKLAKKAYDLLDKKNIELNVVCAVTHSLIPYYMYAADALLLTSFSEGSPNVIKEAMACNIPIVSTDVGDVKEVIGNTEGCFITTYDPKDVAEKIKLALDFGKRTTGRNRIKSLGLDEDSIAKKIIDLYKQVLTDQ